MEGKTVILSVLMMSLVMAQVQVEAEVRCPSVSAKYTYDVCTIGAANPGVCTSFSGCTKVPDDHDILKNSGTDAVKEYCKVECASSVCGALTSLQNSDTNEIVNGAVVEQCTKGCSTFCTKGFMAAFGGTV